MLKKSGKNSEKINIERNEKFNKAKIRYIKGDKPVSIIKKLKEVYEID